MKAAPDPIGSLDRSAGDNEQILQLHAEQIVIERRHVAGDTVRIATTTRLREHQVSEPLVHQRVEIERVAVGKIVDAIPSVREEGDVTILPVVEEVLVLERRLVLKEEVRVRLVQVADTHRETVSLREEIAAVTRSPPG